MNIGSIIEMIKQDPSIKDDVAGFLARVNEKNIRQVDVIRTEIIEHECFVSVADRNGGEAVEEDVMAAIKALEIVPLLEQADRVHEQNIAMIQAGEITDIDTIQPVGDGIDVA